MKSSTSPPGNPAPKADYFRDEYRRILRNYIEAGSEAQLLEANGLGRRVLESGMGVLDIAVIHTDAVADIFARGPGPAPALVVERARGVLLECLAPFELSVRGFRDVLEDIRNKSEQDVMKIFSSAQDGVVTLGVDGRVIDFNHALADMFGYTPEEFRKWTRAEQGGEWAFTIEKAALAQLDERGYFNEYEKEFTRRDGSCFVARISGAMVGGWQEGRAGKAFAFVKDITERARAERTIRESEERYRTLFEAGGTSKCVVGADLKISSCNLEMTRLTHRDAAEIEGSDLRDLVLQEDVELLNQSYKSAIGSGSEGPAHFEARLIRSDGFPVDVIAFLAVLPDRESVLVSFADITLEKIYEKQLEERAKQLSDFLSIASHELGLPVTIIKGYTQTLERHRDALSKKETVEIIASIITSANRLDHLVQELLDVSRVETGRIVLRPEPIQLEPLLLEVIKEMQMQADEHLFNIRVAPGIDEVSADPDKLRQVLMILLDNATRFSPKGSLVEIEVAREGPDIIISILDRGVGVPVEDRSRIFEPFSQVEDVDHHSSSGLGLGLYIASRIMDAHGGRMWYEERSGGGSAFRFLLPGSGDEAGA